METYQPIYDAVRSKISNGNIGRAVEEVLSREGFGLLFEQALQQGIVYAGLEMARPSIMLRLIPKKDGNQWCVLYGDNLQTGIAGFGDTPDKAMREFDKAWVYEEAK